MRIGVLTGGGDCPGLNAVIRAVVRKGSVDFDDEFIGFLDAWDGVLDKRFIELTVGTMRGMLPRGGTIIGTRRGSPFDHEDGPQRVRDVCDELGLDGFVVIGGNGSLSVAAKLHEQVGLPVVGVPKTIDNDIVPIAQSLGAWTAADEGARFFSNVVSEHSANPRTLVVHEVMGRHCGWLTAATALSYRGMLDDQQWLEEFGVSRDRRDIHAVYVPEDEIDIAAEAIRLKLVMDSVGNVNVFLSEGAGVDSIVADMQAKGQEVPRDAFGHVKIDLINPGAWFASQFAPMIGAEKVLVQKSGYFARSAPAGARDLDLIKQCAHAAVDAALSGTPGLIGHDEERGGQLRPVEFSRVKGGKHFDHTVAWFQALLADIGQK